MLMSPTLMCVNCARQDISGISGPRWINLPLGPETLCQLCGPRFMDGSLRYVAGGEGDAGDTFLTGESSRPSIPETTVVATNTTLFTRLVLDKDSVGGGDKFVTVQLRFYVGLCKAGKDVIRKAILAHGGALELHPGTNDDDIIALIESLSRASRFGRVAYSVDFVNACINAGKILDLAPFRLGSHGAMARTPSRSYGDPWTAEEDAKIVALYRKACELNPKLRCTSPPFWECQERAGALPKGRSVSATRARIRRAMMMGIMKPRPKSVPPPIARCSGVANHPLDRLTHTPRSNLGAGAVSPNRRPRSPVRAPPSSSGALSPIDKRSSSKQASRQNREALRGAVRVTVQNLVKQTGISARRAFRALRKEKGDYDRALRLAMHGEGFDSL